MSTTEAHETTSDASVAQVDMKLEVQMRVMARTNWRELDYRQADGGRLRVRLLWNQGSHNLALEVNDRGVERVMALRDPSLARNAFIHPFAYMR
jgi:hypothetical protein